MRRRSRLFAFPFAVVALALTAGLAIAGDDDYVSLVPWKVMEPGEMVADARLVLFWVPASRDELRRSELLTSNELTLYSSQCVAMRVVRLDDRETLERIAVDAELPAVVLADSEGKVLAHAAATDVAEVETIVREELEGRAAEAETMLDDARGKAEEGEVAAAIVIYRRVWEQRCLCPRQARAAQRALRKLEK